MLLQSLYALTLLNDTDGLQHTLQVATGVVQAGVSLDTGFTVVCGMFYKWVGTFDDQLQALTRVRTRADVHPVIFMFVQRGMGRQSSDRKNFPVFLTEAEGKYGPSFPYRMKRWVVVCVYFVVLVCA